MNQKQLEKQLKERLREGLSSFCDAFRKKYPTESICLTDQWNGVELIYYNLLVVAPDIPDNEYYPVLGALVDIYWETTEPNIRQHISKICLETDGDLHCCDVKTDVSLYQNTDNHYHP